MILSNSKRENISMTLSLSVDFPPITEGTTIVYGRLGDLCSSLLMQCPCLNNL